MDVKYKFEDESVTSVWLSYTEEERRIVIEMCRKYSSGRKMIAIGDMVKALEPSLETPEYLKRIG